MPHYELAGVSTEDLAAELAKRPDKPTDLSLAATEELIDVLMERHDHAVVVAMRIICDDEESTNFDIRRTWRGNSHTCLGLLADVQDRILAHTRQTETQAEEEP